MQNVIVHIFQCFHPNQEGYQSFTITKDIKVSSANPKVNTLPLVSVVSMSWEFSSPDSLTMAEVKALPRITPVCQISPFTIPQPSVKLHYRKIVISNVYNMHACT